MINRKTQLPGRKKKNKPVLYPLIHNRRNCRSHIAAAKGSCPYQYWCGHTPAVTPLGGYLPESTASSAAVLDGEARQAQRHRLAQGLLAVVHTQLRQQVGAVGLHRVG